MNDPSQGIQRELLPHIHLVSTYPLPHLPQIHPEKVSEWLQAAPKITRDQAPFYWTYLDRPQDMTVLLVWQSIALSADFPSDGYVWAPQETAVQFQVEGGYTLEMYQHTAGYAPGESIATHSRRRYRLLPPRTSGPQTTQPDPCLWIVHYAATEPNERIPASLIPLDIRMQQIMNTRQYLQSQGQIVQKDFMLHDRSNWPSISFPRNRPQGFAAYGPSLPTARTPHAMAYPPQMAIPGPPTKRIRTQTNSVQPNLNAGVSVFDIEEEEDISRGDLFDHITPREISMSRYKQNHEWMEEVVSSPYAINRIIPSDLGLGIRGELADLTNGIFDAPLDPEKDVPKNSYVGRLDPEKAEEFRRRVTEKIAQTKKDMELLEIQHHKRLAKGQRSSLLEKAEKELCLAAAHPSDTGPEFWRLEGRIEEDASDEKKGTSFVPKVSEIVSKVEAAFGRNIVPVEELIRIQDGGYEEPCEAPLYNMIACPNPNASLPPINYGLNQGTIFPSTADIDMNISSTGMGDYLQEYGV
ncbi:SWI/SNF and RSC complexes subunit ssr4 [Golovinomyces cichoracearum]|uniref:SWI/SNF and RSC complexes subunit ssr4 n=1 Tax=Golovinomyces cichoracearum TaxID=62708 RepID=A0A420H9B6_9PEZI|nr:SWI/SNF and RSC complexes subunit ssr4 [Golovinomyces cichoracearum]